MEHEQSFPSTTWEWRKVKITRPPGGQRPARRSRSYWHPLARWDRSLKLSLSVKWRGGAESWWLIEARGRSGVVPGWMMLEDVMAMIFNEH